MSAEVLQPAAAVRSRRAPWSSAMALATQIVKMICIVLLIAVFNFLLIRAAPGDPALVIAGQSGAVDAQFVDRIRTEYGLDKPLVVQLGTYLGKIAHLDLGYSYRQQRSVLSLILERLPATLMLALSAFVLSLSGGVLLGCLAGVRAGRWSDTVITVISLVVYATPVFWLGLMMVLLFSVHLAWLPAFGYRDVSRELTGWAAALDVARHLVLPAVTLGMLYLAVYTRLMRASIIEVSHQDYVKTARAKGAGPRRVLWRHMVRNALLPVVTMAGLQAGALIGGSVVIETVFAWPGLGRLTYEAVLARDYQVLQGVFFVLSVVVVLFNWLTDLLYRVVDPRIRAA